MIITSFDRNHCRLVSARVIATLQPLAQELGVQIKAGRGSYRGGAFTLKLEVAVIQEGGQAATREATDFLRLAKYHGLDPEHLGATFTTGGNTYRITGWRTKARKRPVQSVRVDNGKLYVWPAARVVGLLA